MSVSDSEVFVSVLDRLANSAEKTPTAPAIAYANVAISFGELDTVTTYLKNALYATGFRQGDSALLLLGNDTPHHLIAQYGVWKAGGTTLTAPLTYTTRQLYALLQQSNANTVFVASRVYDRFKRAQPNTAARRIVIGKVTDYLTGVRKLQFRLWRERAEGHRIVQHYADMRWRDLLKLGAKAPDASVTLSPDTVAQLDLDRALAAVTHQQLAATAVFDHVRTGDALNLSVGN